MLTHHALERCRKRRVPPELALLAVLEGRVAREDARSVVFRRGILRVVVARDGWRIVTVWREVRPDPRRRAPNASIRKVRP
ncbi:MAG: hypothetical protein K6E40_15870 [Desulfovibrio sp.]|nr:hypothetical protein [Desulfovibrio sp.]